jgi:intracellular multiplication protein IcmE
VSALAIGAVVIGVTFSGKAKPAVSAVARMQSVDPNPGGLNSNQEQDALARRANDTAANTALTKGVSYTPPMAPSVPVVNDTPPPPPVFPAQTTSPPPPPAQPVTAPVPTFPPPRAMIQQVDAPAYPPALPGTAVADTSSAQTTADNGGVSDPQQQAAYSKAIDGLFNQWNGRPPLTDVVLQPPPVTNTPTASGQGSGAGAAQMAPTAVQSENSDPAPDAAAQAVLIPAGRGIFAHPILALSSDQTSPVVMQADSGPIAGDRMIGNFATEKNRLIIHIGEIIHDGQPITCDAVVIAPDTMEAAVASGVNQHYVARFLLPAAAAFVQGLGNAIATTSNTTQVLSPLGGATTTTNLNFHQQLGVAAGAAAAQIGSTLDQDAPKGPTVTLDANVAVGVMFLSDVKQPAGT